jgi:uncharacterized protein
MIQILFNRTTYTSLNDCYTPSAGSIVSFSDDGDIEAPGYVHHPNIGVLARPHRNLRILPLDEEHGVAFVPSQSSVAVLNRDAQDILTRIPIYPDETDSSIQQALALLFDLGLLEHDSISLASQHAERKTLTAWLHITNACNLRCTYCYVQKTDESMSLATARAAIDVIIRSALIHGYQHILLKYAGGEPSLEFPLLEQLHTYAVEQSDKYGLHLQALLLSNGTALTPQNLARIRQANMQLSISLDGMFDVHDSQRPSRNGQSTYAATLRGIEYALDGGIRPHVAITVTPHTIESLPALVHWLLTRELAFTLSFYRNPSSCSSAVESLNEHEQSFITGMRQVYAMIEQIPPRWSLLNTLLDRVHVSVPHHQTCAVGRDYLVIDHDGRISKCHMTLDDAVATVESTDPLEDVRADYQGVDNLNVELKEGCQACEWRYWCTGGCPVMAYRSTGSYTACSPYCNIYQSLLPEILLLEGKRLLHWHKELRDHHKTGDSPF